VQQGGGQLGPGDGVGPGVQEWGEAGGVGPQDVEAVVQALEDLGPEPVQIDDVGWEPGRFQLGLEFREGRPRGRGAGTDPLELGRPVPARRPETGVEKPAAGVEDVGSDGGAGGAELVGDGFDETGDGGFGRGVDRGVGHRRHPAVARRGGDDLAWCPRLEHPGQEGEDGLGHAEDVHTEAPAPVVDLLFPRQAPASGGDAGVGEEEIAASLGPVDVIGQGHDRVGVGHVGADPPDRSERGELVDSGGEGAVLHVGHHHLGAAGEQGVDETPAYSAGTAGDDGDLPPVLHGRSSLSRRRGARGRRSVGG